MLTTTLTNLTPGMLAETKELVMTRDALLADLQHANARMVASQWGADRLDALDHANNRIADLAEKVEMSAWELIELAKAFG